LVAVGVAVGVAVFVGVAVDVGVGVGMDALGQLATVPVPTRMCANDAETTFDWDALELSSMVYVSSVELPGTTISCTSMQPLPVALKTNVASSPDAVVDCPLRGTHPMSFSPEAGTPEVQKTLPVSGIVSPSESTRTVEPLAFAEMLVSVIPPLSVVPT
jgi:hypothetical protein